MYIYLYLYVPILYNFYRYNDKLLQLSVSMLDEKSDRSIINNHQSLLAVLGDIEGVYG